MLGFIKNLYDRLPKEFVSFLKYVPDNILFGSQFGKNYSAIETDSSAVIERLFAALNYARDNTVFWSRLVPTGFRKDETFKVYDELPPVSTDDLVKELGQYSSRQFNRMNSYTATTGGTGRHPTTITLSNESYAIEWAHMLYIWKHIGYVRSKNTKLTLRGKTLKGTKFIEYNPIYNELVVDMFKVTAHNFPAVFGCVDNYRIDYIHGYPSLVRELMNYLKLHGLNWHVKGVMLGSEGASVDEKKEISRFFECPVLSWYGQSEKVVLAADLASEGAFAVLTSYGYPSLHQAENGFGEICGTTFVNRALPLIKYRTGDYGRIEDRNGKMVITDLYGRWGKDFIYVDREKKIPTTSLNVHGPAQQEILFYQLYQEVYGKLVIKVLPRRTCRYSEDEIVGMLRGELSEKLRDFEVQYILVEDEKEIVRSERGKAIFLVQDLERT
jgi:phenylacetate-CoA ligase